METMSKENKEKEEDEEDEEDETIEKEAPDRADSDLKVREALEIRRQNCWPGRGLNEDYGAYVNTTQWSFMP